MSGRWELISLNEQWKGGWGGAERKIVVDGVATGSVSEQTDGKTHQHSRRSRFHQTSHKGCFSSHLLLSPKSLNWWSSVIRPKKEMLSCCYQLIRARRVFGASCNILFILSGMWQIKVRRWSICSCLASTNWSKVVSLWEADVRRSRNATEAEQPRRMCRRFMQKSTLRSHGARRH